MSLSRPVFQSRHYEVLAEVIKSMSPEQGHYGNMITALCNRFARDNPNFDADRFRAACLKKDVVSSATLARVDRRHTP